ncbi:hypothetical protein, partial [Oleiphilus sp. HI0123]
TSIIAEAGEDAADVLDELGITSDEANSDFLGEGGVDAFDADLTNQALKLHKVVALFEDVFDEHFDAFGDLSNFPNSASVLIYQELAAVIAAGDTLDTTSLRAVFNSVNAAVSALYTELGDEDETF